MIKTSLTQILLLPFSGLYSLIIGLRNLLYDLGILAGHTSKVPVVVVGNITAGGTGKTPFVVWLANILKENKKIAILSRGYKRKSKGFRWVECNDNPAVTGDEPLEIKRILPETMVAVDRNRLRGINRILNSASSPDLILLDDGFQHRALTPSFAIVLSDTRRPIEKDRLLPAGRLREPISALRRADVLVLTKSTKPLSEPLMQEVRGKLKLSAACQLLQCGIGYGTPYLASDPKVTITFQQLKEKRLHVILVAGIANPKPLETWMAEEVILQRSFIFRDHHAYSQQDIDHILHELHQNADKQTIILTTGKDAVKLQTFRGLDTSILYIIPVRIEMPETDQKKLIKKLLHHV